MKRKTKPTNKPRPGFQLRGEPADTAEPPATQPEQGGDDALPHSYGREKVFLTAKDPHTLFLYWEINVARHPGGPALLRCYRGGEVEQEIEISLEARNWHLRVQHPGATYRVEIGYRRDGDWHGLGASEPAQTPPSSISSSDDFQCATIPLDADFDELEEKFAKERLPDEPLAETLARLQKAGTLPDAFLAALRRLLESGEGVPSSLEHLLGEEITSSLSSAALSSPELQERVRARLAEQLSSWAASPEAAFAAGALSSAALSSAALSSESLSSEVPAGLALAGLLEVFSSAELSSLGLSSRELSSWWTGGAVSSVSSWEAGESSWWSGESSWSGAREFFMHVNAEVIFYGGTHPDAKVRIGGKPVSISKEGNFCFHAVFPDGEDEIPIEAVSPDGMETRRAVLTFRRGTRREGAVGASAQPAVPAPPGAQTVP